MLKIYKEKITPRDSGQEYNNWAFWDDLKDEQKAQKLEGGDDVRAAGYVLSQLKINNEEVFAWEEDNEKGWRIAWNGRLCGICGEEMEFGDDLKCGYHNLEK